MTDDAPLPEKVAHAYELLQAAAADLNAVSGELGKPISKIEETLQRLNLGVSTWVPIRGGDSDDGDTFWFLEVGYAKISNRWGVAIRTRRGSYSLEEEHTDPWLFENAPRRFRGEAVSKLPELLTELTNAATKTRDELRERVGEAQQIAKAFGPKVTAGAQARALEATGKASARAVERGAGIMSDGELARAIEQAQKATGLAASGELARALEQAHKATGLATSGELQRLIADAQKATGLANRGELQRLIAEAQKMSGLATSGELARMMADAQNAVGTISASDAARALLNARRK